VTVVVVVVDVAFAFAVADAFASAVRAICVIGGRRWAHPVYKYLCRSHSCESAKSGGAAAAPAGDPHGGAVPHAQPPPRPSVAAVECDGDACRPNGCGSSTFSSG